MLWFRAGAVLSVGLMVAVGVLGPSAAVPEGDWGAARLHPGDLTVILLLWPALLLGTAATVAGLRMRDRLDGRRLFWWGAAGAAVLVLVPPLGSTDMMDYATYGRIAVLGRNPHVMTPGELRAFGDPVAALSSDYWSGVPSVYGPVATGVQWLAARLGGESAAAIVFWLKAASGLAFLGGGLVLARLTDAVRAHLLWTANPLMLWAVCAGGHIDGLATALAIGGLWLLLRGNPVVAGALVGLATAVKAPFLLFGAASLRSARTAVLLGAGVAAVLVPGYLLVGPRALQALADRNHTWSWMSPWSQFVRWFPLPDGLWPVLTWASFVLFAALLLRGLPAGRREVRLVLALALSWVVTTPIYHPWYDVMVFALLVLLPASRFDWLLLARGGIAAACALPGVRLSTAWLTDAGDSASSTVPLLMLLFALLLGLSAARRRAAPAVADGQAVRPPLGGPVVVAEVRAPARAGARASGRG